jgi:hypothetical protein
MEIEIRCPHCQKKYRLPVVYKERAIKCRVCGYPFFVLVPTSARPAPASTSNDTHFVKNKAADETQVAMPAIDPKASPGQ